MPCKCWYEPADKDIREIKELCQKLVDAMKAIQAEGDPYWGELEDIHELIDHLYNPSKCKENPRGRS